MSTDTIPRVVVLRTLSLFSDPGPILLERHVEITTPRTLFGKFGRPRGKEQVHYLYYYEGDLTTKDGFSEHSHKRFSRFRFRLGLDNLVHEVRRRKTQRRHSLTLLLESTVQP